MFCFSSGSGKGKVSHSGRRRSFSFISCLPLVIPTPNILLNKNSFPFSLPSPHLQSLRRRGCPACSWTEMPEAAAGARGAARGLCLGLGSNTRPHGQVQVGGSEPLALWSRSRLVAESYGRICFSRRFWAAGAGPGLGGRGWSSPPSPEPGVALPQVPVQT